MSDRTQIDSPVGPWTVIRMEFSFLALIGSELLAVSDRKSFASISNSTGEIRFHRTSLTVMFCWLSKSPRIATASSFRGSE